YADLGRLYLGEKGKPDEFYVEGFVDYLYEMASRINLPGLAGFGLKEADVELICAQTENKNNPVKPGMEELMEILREVVIG
ncbi:MAG: hypothetical protein IH594_15850, partial [Bacteroidales bacterium]|nr:hypothetical protein [Bacteroidales bacterium]